MRLWALQLALWSQPAPVLPLCQCHVGAGPSLAALLPTQLLPVCLGKQPKLPEPMLAATHIGDSDGVPGFQRSPGAVP